MRSLDLIGVRFGRLVVVSEMRRYRENSGAPRRRFRCRCDCGRFISATRVALRSKSRPARSCGCLQRDRSREANTTHGASRATGGGTAEYRTWKAMLQRCHDPSYKQWKDYGGRGIGVCVRWRVSFSSFLADMGKKPSRRHSIDRKDVNGNYTPTNCRWATPFLQNSNRRKNFTHYAPRGAQAKIVMAGR